MPFGIPDGRILIELSPQRTMSMENQNAGVDALASLRKRVEAARQPKVQENEGHLAGFYRFLLSVGEKKEKK